MCKTRLAIAAGYTKAITVTHLATEFELLAEPTADFDERFRAWDHERQRYIWVNGWMVDVTTDEPDQLLAGTLSRLATVDLMLIAA